MQRMLATLVKENQDDWDTMLPYVVFAYNTSTHLSTKCSPFEVIHGRYPRIPLHLQGEGIEFDLALSPESYARGVQENLEKAYARVASNRYLRMSKEKTYYDRKVVAANFQVGDLVLIMDTTKKKGLSKKFSKRWSGPYIVLKQFNEVDYELRLLGGNKRTKQHQNRLKKAHVNQVTRERLEKRKPQSPYALQASQNTEVGPSQLPNPLPEAKKRRGRPSSKKQSTNQIQTLPVQESVMTPLADSNASTPDSENRRLARQVGIKKPIKTKRVMAARITQKARNVVRKIALREQTEKRVRGRPKKSPSTANLTSVSETGQPQKTEQPKVKRATHLGPKAESIALRRPLRVCHKKN